MEHEVRVALYNIKCLGRPASDPQCSAESAAIDAEKAALQAEYKQTTRVFDGTWIFYTCHCLTPPQKTVMGLLLILFRFLHGATCSLLIEELCRP